jgi:hypothetical protein
VRLFKRYEAKGKLVFRFERPEREMFVRILELYPVQQGSMRRIGDDENAQELLEKALQEQRGKLRAEAERLLQSNGELVIDAEFNEFWDLTLSEAEVEWILQMLNDVRVGLWAQIGCPNPSHDIKVKGEPSDELVRAHVIMQLCATWQAILMQAVDGTGEVDQL